MNAEQDIINRLVEGSKAVDSVHSVIHFNTECKAEPPTKEVFWKHLVLALLTSQQPSAKPGGLVELFEKKVPFPLALKTFESMSDDAVREELKHFRFGKPITGYLRVNYDKIFGKGNLWSIIEPKLEKLLQQRNDLNPPVLSHKNLERIVSHLLASNLKGVGPKQSRNLLQWLGITRYEIPLDSRVVGWLGDNLGWNINIDSLKDEKEYEFWLDRLQSVCDAAGVLPTVFDAAAFDKGKATRTLQSPTTRIGYVNKNGQVVVRNSRMPGTDNNQVVYQLGCSQCGEVYGANGTDIFERKCPKCQDGRQELEYTTP
jgi:hypothetical protein